MKKRFYILSIIITLSACGSDPIASHNNTTEPNDQKVTKTVCMKDFFSDEQVDQFQKFSHSISKKPLIVQSLLLSQFMILTIGVDKVMEFASRGLYLDWYATKDPKICKTIEESLVSK